MVFTIENEDYTFSLVLDESNQMTGFTATKDQVTYDCGIHLKSRTQPQEYSCCYPPPIGCQPGGC